MKNQWEMKRRCMPDQAPGLKNQWEMKKRRMTLQKVKAFFPNRKGKVWEGKLARGIVPALPGILAG